MNEIVDTSRVMQRSAKAGPPIPDGAPKLATDEQIAAPLPELPKLESKVFKLSVPIKKPDGGLITEIVCRLPTGMDLFEIGGLPSRTIWTNQGMTVEMDSPRLKAWLGRLADWDPPTLYRAPARDLRAMYEWLIGELNPAGN